MPETVTAPLRLASYNIRAALGTDLRRDPERVLRAIRDLDADVIALQEADHRLGQRPSALPHGLIEERTGLVPLPVAATAGSLGWHGIALLARPHLRAARVRRFALPGLEPRGAVVVDVEDTGTGGLLRIAGVHLGLLRSSRRAQLDRIRDELAGLPPMPTVVLGDFNEWSRVRGLGRLARDYRILTPPRTFPSRMPLAALDRVAHSPDLSVRFIETPAMRHPHPSDHRPILAEVSPAG